MDLGTFRTIDKDGVPLIGIQDFGNIKMLHISYYLVGSTRVNYCFQLNNDNVEFIKEHLK